MASKRRFSYQLRLFIPMLGMMLAIIGVLIVFQYRRESDYRKSMLERDLKFICQRIIDAYQRGTNLRPFVNFINEYYEGSLYDDISVNVYSSDGKLMYHAGLPVLQDFTEVSRPSEEAFNAIKRSATYREQIGDMNYLVRTELSKDGKIFVYTAMPYTLSIGEALSIGSDIWIMLAVITAAAIIGCIFSTRLLTRSVNLLRDFANRAGNSEKLYDADKFPHDELGDVSRQIVKLYHDRTEAVKRSEKEHRIALHAVEEKARLKRDLTNNINHELKTPVGVIRGYLDTIISNPDMDAATRERFMKRTWENVERLCLLLNDVSTMTRLEDGAGNVPVTEVDFHDLVFTIENDLTISGLAGNMTFHYNLPLDCTVKGNSHLLSGMVSNLIKNAAIHSHGTEMGLKLVVESEKYYTFSFYDNGTGVEPQHLPHLFERFYRIDAGRARKTGGTGLGLPIVKNTIEALGGTISVHNRSGGGLEFLFTLEKWRGGEA